MLGSLYPNKNNNLQEKGSKNRSLLGRNYSNSDRYSTSLEMLAGYEQEQANSEESKNLDVNSLSEDTEQGSQYEFSVSPTRRNWVQQVSDDIRRWENIVEVMPFWRNYLNPINFTFATFTILFLAVTIIFNFEKLPNELGLIYSQANNSAILVEKPLLAVLPIVVVVFELLILRFKRLIFEFDRRLGMIMATTQIFFNLVLIIGLVQIQSLLLV